MDSKKRRIEYKTKLEIGCGFVKNKDKDTLYLDIKDFDGVDVVRDVEKGLPFNDMVFDEVKAHHVLEHVNDLIFVMNEIHRVLVPDGIVDIEVPYGVNAWIDPSHVRCFEINGFDFFVYKDFNSVNSGVRGWFEFIKGERIMYNKDVNDIRGLRFIMKKVLI